ncbi:Serine/threonine exchanger SteT [Mesomycoplasma conjunctivae]|uniref:HYPOTHETICAL Y+L amino acid transporter 1 n=1 Tax=Mesomycoplasma conjunctivae (strain ATCC 25834 / NCTC 10147 / HRC/581) TaxID=572263 RepID=C5J6V8_MESCH|nr:amino acid permease [Mesomycoplasma conjunctivae]CAT05221.1 HYPOTHETICAL Y+L amino acid transporter 1 [Mesomycoplasma conjunctivae]VEU66441.1 Serine/threonine exchanger SteT [Mesomycoplasma conjunctivae]
MSSKSARKLGFFAASAMLIGSVVGVGIFFKNGSIARATDSNGIAWLLAWIIGGIISLFAAINYSEISFLKPSKLNGLASWAYRIKGKKWGYFILFNYSFYYLSILGLLLSIIASEVTIYFISEASGKSISIPFYAHLLIGLAYLVFFVVLNFISIYTSGYIALITTILKFVPLIISLLAGIILPNTFNDGGQSTFVKEFIASHPFDFKKVVIALPAVLFAYDSFLSVGSLHNKVKNANKRVPLIIVASMILIVVVYTLIGLSSALHNKGNILDLIRDVFPKEAAKGIGIFVALFLLISTLGVNNSFNAIYINQIRDLVAFNSVFGAKSLKAKFGQTKATIFYIIAVFIFWAIIIYVPSLAAWLPTRESLEAGGELVYKRGSDVIADSMSNFPSLIFFGLYMAIMIVYANRRKTLSNPKTRINDILFWVSSIFANIIIGVTIFAFVYTIISEIDLKPFAPSSAGILADNGLYLTNSGNFGIFIFQLIIFLFFPIINYYLIKKVEKYDLFKEFDKLVEIDDSSEIQETQTI